MPFIAHISSRQGTQGEAALFVVINPGWVLCIPQHLPSSGSKGKRKRAGRGVLG